MGTAFKKGVSRPPLNSHCPYSREPLSDEAVELVCGHSLCLERLATALASSRRFDMGASGCLICPLCGQATSCEAGAADKSRAPTSVYSKSKLAAVGHMAGLDWQRPTTLPMNV